jgi:colanic acid biosynthesis protein WcaH
LPKDQHSNYKWLSEKSLLIDNIVHKHTKWYFQKEQNADAPFAI